MDLPEKGLVKIDDAIRKYKESLELKISEISILHYLPSFLDSRKNGRGFVTSVQTFVKEGLQRN
jgi:hypothetical protein